MEQLIIGNNLEITTKEQMAIEYIKMFEPAEGYYLAFSGGKDSIVCYELLKRANVKFDAHYNWTTVDPPELLYFIKENYPDVEIVQPEISMWRLIESKLMPPTRIVRYCCDALKENGGSGRFVVTGVRWAESTRRKNSRSTIEFDVYGSKSKKAIEQRKIFLNSDNDDKRKMIEHCQIKGKHILNPIVSWEDFEVWTFIKSNNLKFPSMHENGYSRIGCIGCPMQGPKGMKKDFEFYPKHRENYVKAFDRMLKRRKEKGFETKWKNGEEVMEWWIGSI